MRSLKVLANKKGQLVVPEFKGMYPKFGIDYLPVGVDKKLASPPKAIPNTFYDLFSPDVTYKEERQKIIKEQGPDRKKRVRNTSGNPKNYYTFKALFKTFFTAALNDILKVVPPERKRAFTFLESDLNAAMYGTLPRLSRYIEVKKQSNNFIVRLPISSISLYKLFEAAIKMDDEVSENGGTPGTDLVVNNDIFIVGGAINYSNSFAESVINASSFFPFNVGPEATSGTLETFIPKSKVSSVIDPSYKKAAGFYSKYVRGYFLRSTKRMPMLSNYEDTAAFLNALAPIDYSVFVEVALPASEAQYYCQKEANQITVQDVISVFGNWYRHAITTQTTTQSYPTYQHSIETISKKSAGFPIKNKADSNNLILATNNTIYWVPSHFDGIQEYKDAINEVLVGSAEEEDVDFYSLSNSTVDSMPKNKLVYVDWVNEKFLYTGNDGYVLVRNMDVTYKVRPASYIGMFYKPLDEAPFMDSVDFFVHNLKKFSDSAPKFGLDESGLNSLITYLSGINPSATSVALQTVNKEAIKNNFASYYAFISAFVKECSNKTSLAGRATPDNAPAWVLEHPLTLKTVYDNRHEPVFSNIGYIGALYSYLFNGGEENTIKIINNIGNSPTMTMSSLGVMKMLGAIKDFEAISVADFKDRAPYLNQNDIDMESPINLKNGTGLSALMHHQAKVIKKLEKTPEYAVISVAAGGGKTLVCLINILQMLDNGEVKRPLVLCPNNLIKDYVKEANFLGRGTINVIPLDASVFQNYCYKGKDGDTHIWDYSRLFKLITDAPINTIVVMGYDVISRATSNKELQVYGTEAVDTYSHLDFMLSCGFDGVWCDESHYLKGADGSDSARLYVNRMLISRIKYKRLLTGTVAPNTLVDLVKQFELFNPGILGTVNQFRRMFDATESISGPFVPKRDAIGDINRIIQANSTFVNIQRKEWAAFLPELHEKVANAELTENQKKVYKILIDDAINEIEGEMSKEEKDSLFNEDMSEDSTEIDNIFEKYEKNLAAVEAFLSNPMSIPVSEQYLTSAEDKLSPKGKVVNDILRMHLITDKEKYPGKILIFCNTHAAVEGIWEALDPEIQAQTIYYSAANKTEFEGQFNTDPTKRVMLGISQSLDTGLNLQAADTLIRVDTVWTPGRLEQGNARINRPNLKAGVDPRMETGIHCYYVTVDRTIDTVKFAKLTSKTVQLAHFYNADDPRYQEIGLDDDGEFIEPIRISFDLLRAGMSKEDLLYHTRAYQELRDLEHEIYVEYANDHPEVKSKFPVTHTGLLEGSKILRNVPYIAGANLANADDLGLVPYSQYKRDWILKNGEENWTPEGLAIHTEFGDGICERETNTTIRVRFDSGKYYDAPFGVAFVITKKTTSSMEIRDLLAQSSGLDVEDNQLKNYRAKKQEERLRKRQEKERIAEEKRQAREEKRRKQEEEIEKRKKQKTTVNPLKVVKVEAPEVNDYESEEDDDENYRLDLDLTPTNGMIALSLASEDPAAEINLFKGYGFRVTRPYILTEIKTKDSLTRFLDGLHKLIEKGTIEIPEDLWDAWEALEEEFSTGRAKLLNVSLNTKADIKKFVLTSWRRVRNPTLIRVLPVVEQIKGKNRLFAQIDLETHSPTTINKVRRMVIPGVRWEAHDPELRAYFSTKGELADTLRKIERDGWIINDRKNLQSAFKLMKISRKGRPAKTSR